MNALIQAIILSFLPISELRGGIIIGLANNYHFLLVYLVCVLANLLVIPIVFFFLDYFHKYFYKIPIYKKLFDKIVKRTRKKLDKKFAKYEYWAFFLFVAVPLPITGAYTGTLAAWLLGANKKKAFLYLGLGVITAGIIVTLVYLLGIETLNIFLKK